jgi:hypothetical protein
MIYISARTKPLGVKMATELKTRHIVLNEGQAAFLKTLSRVCEDYRNSWDALTRRGAEEADRLENGYHIAGPSHQVMSEVEQEAGKIKALTDVVWSVFRVDNFAEGDRKDAYNEVNDFLKLAMATPKGKNVSFSGIWFKQGQTLSDFE